MRNINNTVFPDETIPVVVMHQLTISLKVDMLYDCFGDCSVAVVVVVCEM